MAKHSENSRPDGTQQSDGAAEYDVGYRRPPRSTRFKPGHTKCGGRRKGQRNTGTVVAMFLNERISFTEGKRPRTMTKHDAMCLNIVNAAVAGNDKAQSKVIAITTAQEAPEATEQEPFTADDAALLADFLRRYGNQASPTESKENPETGKAESPSKEAKETKG